MSKNQATEMKTIGIKMNDMAGIGQYSRNRERDVMQ